jgi:hypothetical protein
VRPDRDAIRLDVMARNELRRSAGLPLLDVDAETERLIQVEIDAAFERFLDGPFASRVFRRAWWRRRDQWPKFMVGMAIRSAVGGALREQFDQVQDDGS